MSDLDGGAPRPERVARPVPRARLVERVREWVAWFGVGRLIAGSFAVLAVGAGGFWLLRTPPAPVEARLPMASTSNPTDSPPDGTRDVAVGSTSIEAHAPPSGTAAAEPSSTLAADIVVHVAGAVRSPGVYRLPPSARVVDAVAAAGGPVPGADANALNQAQVLHDGDRVSVPLAGEVVALPAGVSGSGSAPGGPTSSSPAGPIDVNRAAADELDRLPGVGAATAAAIVAHRDQHGPFASVEDLGEVRGIGPAKLDALRGLVTT